ncbi:NAD(P)-dependent oxidoreductase [Mesomycoplasma lagogenitalium]|uniref:NAD(P)-dependent oxidoreductase n=1 Tax=Mesomycoplasma lagogenitalium TaxID=171286 RepID=A0ABY8LUY8_9BACT|nr:NAD(P)-dependent oxidoreductase [Mesomycoplasma lagogenitalium]
MKVICFGVRKVEEPIFHKFNKYGYELELRSNALTEETVDSVKGFDAIITRASDKVTAAVVEKVNSFGIKYLLTRTVGTDHLDLKRMKELDIKSARVPSYSPTAISELAFSMALMLNRKTLHFADKGKNNDFTVDAFGFAREFKNTTVGVIGTGKIGYWTAHFFKSVGAKVYGYDIYPNEKAKEVLEYTDLDNLLAKSDIISFHIPYIKGQNDKMINKEFIEKMKDNSILINTARGQIQDEEALLWALETNKLSAIATDVFNKESEIFFKKHESKVPNSTVAKLMEYYPRFVVTPHIGSYTDEAVANMVETSFDNLNDFLTTNDSKNKV